MSGQQGTVFELLHSHGRIEDALYFATISEDYSRVVRHYISQKQYAEALRVLSDHHSVQLYEQYAPELLLNAPTETINGMYDLV